jgi:hypothetical protein
MAGLSPHREAAPKVNVDAENQILINHNLKVLNNDLKNKNIIGKCVCGALNRQFFVGAVMGWFYYLRILG